MDVWLKHGPHLRRVLCLLTALRLMLPSVSCRCISVTEQRILVSSDSGMDLLWFIENAVVYRSI